MNLGDILKRAYPKEQIKKIAHFTNDDIVRPFTTELVKDTENTLDDGAVPIIHEFVRAAIDKLLGE